MLFVGKVAGINSSDGRINLLVTDKNKEDWTCNKDLMSWLTALAKK